jgi:hypothetical protein
MEIGKHNEANVLKNLRKFLEKSNVIWWSEKPEE